MKQVLLTVLAVAKTHLSHIFLKTGTRRQADLISLAAALALPLRP